MHAHLPARRFNDALTHQKAVDKAYDELEAARKKVRGAVLCRAALAAPGHPWRPAAAAGW